MIDLRSDTVTLPTPPMRAAMAAAEVGDDVYGEDPTVNRLQEMSAEMLGKEAALFVPSGTQGNLLGILCHCERGDEYITGGRAHTYRREGGGAAVLGSVQPQPLDFEPDGTLDLELVESLVKPMDPHFARTRLLCLEDTQGGLALPLDYLEAAADTATRLGLGLHLDGARLFNAAVKQGVPVDEITGHFDTISFCLSKGLGAPVGSVLCGSKELIDKAHRWRKVLGGGMRQVGVLAAPALVALDAGFDHIHEDHRRARTLAEAFGVDPAHVDTNIVIAQIEDAKSVEDALKERGIWVFAIAEDQIRLVTHRDVNDEDVDRACAAAADVLA